MFQWQIWQDPDDTQIVEEDQHQPQGHKFLNQISNRQLNKAYLYISEQLLSDLLKFIKFSW